MEKDIKKQCEEEINKRIEEIESPQYKYVQTLGKKDYIGMGIVAVACITVIIVGLI